MRKTISNKDLYDISIDIRDQFTQFQDRFEDKIQKVADDNHGDHAKMWDAINKNENEIAQGKGIMAAISFTVSLVSTIVLSWIKKFS